MDDILKQLNQAVVRGEAPAVGDLVRQALDGGLDVGVVLEQGP